MLTISVDFKGSPDRDFYRSRTLSPHRALLVTRCCGNHDSTLNPNGNPARALTASQPYKYSDRDNKNGLKTLFVTTIVMILVDEQLSSSTSSSHDNNINRLVTLHPKSSTVPRSLGGGHGGEASLLHAARCLAVLQGSGFRRRLKVLALVQGLSCRA